MNVYKLDGLRDIFLLKMYFLTFTFVVIGVIEIRCFHIENNSVGERIFKGEDRNASEFPFLVR